MSNETEKGRFEGEGEFGSPNDTCTHYIRFKTNIPTVPEIEVRLKIWVSKTIFDLLQTPELTDEKTELCQELNKMIQDIILSQVPLDCVECNMAAAESFVLVGASFPGYECPVIINWIYLPTCRNCKLAVARKILDKEAEEKLVKFCQFCHKYSVNFACCQRCKTAHYCSTECQSKDWKREGGHKIFCNRFALSKKEETSSSLQCQSCHKFCKNAKCCGRCQAVYYCSKECQRLHWKKVHKNECVPVIAAHGT